MLELERPDIVRPTFFSLVVASFMKKTDEGVLLNWVNSTSRDVVGHSIYRTENLTTWNGPRSILLTYLRQHGWTAM